MPYYIPQEILDKIIGCATADEPKFGRNFSSCASLVSHTFHQIVLPYKFRSLTFEFHNFTPFFGTTVVVPMPKFCEAIKAGDAHALSLVPLVQELSLISSYSDTYDNHFLPGPFEKIINGVVSFGNLTKLNLFRCVASPVIMEQLGKLVQLQSLRTFHCQDTQYGDEVSYGALSNLRSLHTLECEGDWKHFKRHLACISMKNLRILKSRDWEVVKALLTTDPPVQLKELWLTRRYRRYSLLWDYLAMATSLTHLSLPYLGLSDGPPSLIFPLQELQYLHIHVAFAPRFADQPMKKMIIYTESETGQVMVEVRQHWQGIVFPHVEYLEVDRFDEELEEIPIEFWREFLLNVNEVVSRHVVLDSLPSKSMLIFLFFVLCSR